MNARSQSWPAVLILSIALLSVNFFYSRPAQAHPGSDADIDMFYGALAPYGTWVNHSVYGRAWYPRGVSRGWRPYTDGHWNYTREYGWVWVSDWIWGWAPFHYGRWVWDDWYGWIWLPGRVWAPAWVFWRYGGGYAAWAPMPPTAVWRPGYGLNTHYFDYDRDLRRDGWICLPERHLHERHIKRHIIDPRRNNRYLNVTKHFVNVKNVNNAVVNEGVPVRQIEKNSGRRVRVVPVREIESIEDRNREKRKGALTIVRPKITAPDADEIRRQEELAQHLSRQNEKQRRARPRPRTEGQPEIKLPGRLRKAGAVELESGVEKGRESFAPPLLQEGQEQQRWQDLQDRQQIEQRRRQGEETEHRREEKARQPQLQERQEQKRRQELQERQQIEQRRRQGEETEHRREEKARQQSFQQQRQNEERRRQAEQNERARQESQRQQLERQRQMQRGPEMEQRQMEIQRRESPMYQRRLQQQEEDAGAQQLHRNRMPPKQIRPYAPDYGGERSGRPR